MQFELNSSEIFGFSLKKIIIIKILHLLRINSLILFLLKSASSLKIGLLVNISIIMHPRFQISTADVILSSEFSTSGAYQKEQSLEV